MNRKRLINTRVNFIQGEILRLKQHWKVFYDVMYRWSNKLKVKQTLTHLTWMYLTAPDAGC